ncbi:hypothetical protein FGW84_02085 [Xylella fastidiosa subsp. multiplex]|nr:hypothetical protein [Xylella fastidiosa subsp. multiplex]MRT45180.1 hypothetical protein [Xylella fastidiosa subsp. multiplex]MRT95393.1 hypothetical protein [Xylella fastidiosa subsp. multiplex]MRU27645.1 hypothetical protein [Xylella fastidiosa subsp. multiplex]MRU30092.1 hypothetical protein [Xylella fastidiosa subsp. multiplex]
MPPHFPPYCTRLSGAMPSSNDLLAPCPPQQGFFFFFLFKASDRLRAVFCVLESPHADHR